MEFRKYDGKRIAVVLSINGIERLVTGVADCVDDPSLGTSICIVADDSPPGMGSCELLVSESQWNGEIADGSQYGCDFCFRCAAKGESSASPPGAL